VKAVDKAWMRGFATCVTGVRDVLHEQGYAGQAAIRMLVENNGFDLPSFEGCGLADIDIECMRWVFADDSEERSGSAEGGGDGE
jgi:hypothetical protein